MKKNTVGSRIKQARLTAGITQTQLAQRVGLSAQSISAFEQGRITPEIKYIEIMARVLHLPLHMLTGESLAIALAKIDTMIEELKELRKTILTISQQDTSS